LKSIADESCWAPPDKEQGRFLRPRQALLIVDVVNACLGFGSMDIFLWYRGIEDQQMTVTMLNGGAALILSLILLLRSRQYSAHRRLSSLSTSGVFARDVFVALAITTLLSYLTKGFFTGLTTPSRLALGIALGVFCILGLGDRVGLGLLQRRQYEAGLGVRRILVAGDGAVADELLKYVAAHPQLGVVIGGRLRLDVPEWSSRPDAATADAGPVTSIAESIAGLHQLDRVLRSTRATEVVIALDPEDQAALPKLTVFLGLAHVPFRVVPALFEDAFRAVEVLGSTEIPVVDLGVTPLDRVGRMVKRSMDVVIALVVLVMLLPLLMFIALAILVDSGRPIIFAQQRVGKNGRRFTLYKFRTMVKDAEAKLKEVESHNELSASDGLMFKMRRDPRINRVGRVLRKCSLDELPQFFNVLIGNMSVVGPRPPLPREVSKYERGHLCRLRVLPGITGLWQISGRNELSFEEMVSLDRYYVNNWSLRMDLSIMLRTMGVVVNRKGAY
jgi:exopolysaccharide biosynthesis polyprenyl glycosylphosphotransferase